MNGAKLYRRLRVASGPVELNMFFLGKNMIILTATFNFFMFLFVLILLWVLKHWQTRHSIVLALLLGFLFVILSLTVALISPAVYFGQLQLMAWAVFLYFPLYLGGVAILFSKTKPVFAGTAAGLGMCIVLIGLYASWIEPHWLEVSHLTLSDAKIDEPIRVAVVADLQTDQPGAYEERVLNAVRQEAPDLILLAGDYLQIIEPDRYPTAQRMLHDIFLRADLTAPLGMFAVRGNVDPIQSWQGIFDGLPIFIFEQSSSIDLGPVVLTGLTLEDSEDLFLSIEGEEKFHIVLGHRPDFSLGEIDADLLIAGHTHGGQFQIPFIGPLVTLSAVPREWASGMTMISPGKILLVSRGIGLERGNAPRMRFNCRPELIILDLVPAESSK
jgi:predicted MPP superfamily phosphohydrolase